MGYAAQSMQGVWTTYVPTFTGFSVQPTAVVASSTRLGAKIFSVNWEMATAGGTSNAGTLTMTMPLLAKSQVRYPCFILNNGVFETGQVYTTAGSNILTFYRGVVAFTSSGAKGCYGCIIVEEQ